MTAQRMTAPSGAVTLTTSVAGDEVQIRMSIDASAGTVAATEAVVMLDAVAESIRRNFGVRP